MMTLMLDTTNRLFSPAEAEAAAVEMAACDPDWSYKVVHDPQGTGFSFVEVYDEGDHYVGRL